MCFVFWLDNLCLICLLFSKGIWWGGGVMTEQIIHLFHYMFITPVTYTFSITHNDLLRMCQQNDTSAQMEIKARRCFILCNHLTWMSLINCMNVVWTRKKSAQPRFFIPFCVLFLQPLVVVWLVPPKSKTICFKTFVDSKESYLDAKMKPYIGVLLYLKSMWGLALPTEKSSLFWPAAKTKAKLVERDLFLNYWC